ncbi:hypothetical protein PWT90_09277 [Aphanocladium album]|nr:hypothetical protein PWT90_09277 [Aphanocladium album]
MKVATILTVAIASTVGGVGAAPATGQTNYANKSRWLKGDFAKSRGFSAKKNVASAAGNSIANSAAALANSIQDGNGANIAKSALELAGSIVGGAGGFFRNRG